MTLKIKKIRGRGYYYNDVSQRIGGKVKTTSVYLGPVNPKRKKRGSGILGGFGVVGLTVPNLIMGAGLVAVLAAQGKLKTRNYPPAKPHDPLHREKQKANNQLREVYAKFQMDDTDPAKFQASYDRLPKEMQNEVRAARAGIFSRFDTERARSQPKAPTPARSPEMQAFSDRMAAVSADQAAKSAATDTAPAPDAAGETEAEG